MYACAGQTCICIRYLFAAQIQIVDMTKESYSENDVVIMGSDGLWDVIPNLKALEIVNKSLSHLEHDNEQR